MRGILILMAVTLWICLLSFPVLSQDEYKFDLSEIEKEIQKKPYSLGGFIELRPVLFGLDRDAAFYMIKFFNQDEGSTLEQYNFGLRLEGSYQKGISSIYFKTDGFMWHDYQGWDEDIDLLPLGYRRSKIQSLNYKGSVYVLC